MLSIFKWFFYAWVALVLLSLGMGVFGAVADSTVPENSVLRVTLNGELRETPDESFMAMFDEEAPLSLHQLTTAVRRAADDENIKGLVLSLHQPALGVAQIAEFERAMKVFRDSGKWNVAFLETAGELSRGDGAYALAACASEIVLAPSGDITLLGLRAEVPFIKQTIDRLGLDVRVEKRHAYKNFGNTFDHASFSAEHREALSTLVNDLESELTAHMSARRNKTAEDVASWIAAAPLPASEALEKGLVDTLGYWGDILTGAKKASGRDDSLLSAQSYFTRSAEAEEGPTLALITISGQIMRGSSDTGLSDDTAGSTTITNALREAREEEVKGVLLRINSPGGSYVASDLIRHEVAQTRAQGIPVVVSMGDVAASGGYLVAIAADRIVAEPASITGSIGVIAVSVAARRFFEKWFGVTFDVYETHPGSGVGSGLDPPTKAQSERLAKSLDRIYDEFVNASAKARNMSRDDMHAVAQGRVWSGTRALEHGLIDELGGLRTALARLEELAEIPPGASTRLQRFPAAKTGVEQVLDMLNMQTRIGAKIRTLTARIAPWATDNRAAVAKAPLPKITP